MSKKLYIRGSVRNIFRKRSRTSLNEIKLSMNARRKLKVHKAIGSSI